MSRWIVLFPLWAQLAHSWLTPPTLIFTSPSFQLRARPSLQLDAEPPAYVTGAATGAKIDDEDKTNGIPNYMLRSSGTITRIAEGQDSSVQSDGVLYEQNSLVSIMTSDVIDMVQQQGGAAEKIDYLGEDILVEGLLFDDFMPEDTFEIISSVDDQASDVVTPEIVEPRSSTALVLDQLGDDDSKRQSIATLLSQFTGFSGWTARVLVAGRVSAGFKIAKGGQSEGWVPSRHDDDKGYSS